MTWSTGPSGITPLVSLHSLNFATFPDLVRQFDREGLAQVACDPKLMNTQICARLARVSDGGKLAIRLDNDKA